MKIQINQQHDKSKFKNTYRIKEISIKGKTYQCHLKRRSSEEEVKQTVFKVSLKDTDTASVSLMPTLNNHIYGGGILTTYFSYGNMVRIN